MSACAKCGSNNEAGSEFCQNCGASMPQAIASGVGSSRFAGAAGFVGSVGGGRGTLTFIERTIYFRIARVFAWLLLILSLLGLVGGVYLTVGSARQYLKGEGAVSVDDVKAATQLDPKAEGQLTTVAAEIFNLLSAEDQNRDGGKGAMMSQLRTTAEIVNGASVGAQIYFLREMKMVLNEIQPQSDRRDGMRGFITLKQNYKKQATARKAAAEMDLMKGGGAVLSFAALITLVSMVLVMLAVERNTRST